MRKKIGRYTYDTDRAHTVYEVDNDSSLSETDEAFMSFEVYRRDDDGRLFVVFTSGGDETLFVPTFLKMKRVESEIARAEEHMDWRRIVSFAWFMDLFHEEVGM